MDAGAVASIIASAVAGLLLVMRWWWKREGVRAARREAEDNQVIEDLEAYRRVRQEVDDARKDGPATAGDAREWLRDYVDRNGRP